MPIDFRDSDDKLIAQAYEFTGETTEYPSPWQFNLQFGIVNDPEGKTYRSHVHLDTFRSSMGTAEFIMVLVGQMDIDVLDESGLSVGSLSLKPNMAFIQAKGGHKITTVPGTRFIEVKQGPYYGSYFDKRFLDAPETQIQLA